MPVVVIYNVLNRPIDSYKSIQKENYTFFCSLFILAPLMPPPVSENTVNLSQLQYFVEAVSTGSFTSAGRNLFSTPQAISKAMSELEKELQVQLFYRKGKQVEPTPIAKLLAHKASEALSCVEDIRTISELHTSQNNQEGQLSVALSISPYRGGLDLEPYLQDFKNAFPLIEIESFANFGGICTAAVRDGFADVAITIGRFEGDDIKCVRLFEIEPFIALSKLHPLASEQEIAIGDLAKYPIAVPSDLGYFYHLLKSYFSERKATPKFEAIAPSAASHLSFMMTKNGVIYASNNPTLFEIYQGVTLRKPVAEDRISLPVCMIYSANNDNPALPTFINHALTNRHLPKKIETAIESG